MKHKDNRLNENNDDVRIAGQLCLGIVPLFPDNRITIKRREKTKCLHKRLLEVVAIFYIAAWGVQADIQNPWETIVLDEQTESLGLAVVDLQRYVSQITGVVPTVVNSSQWIRNPHPAVIVGTCADSILFSKTSVDCATLSEQGFMLYSCRMYEQPVLMAIGKSSIGAVNAVYGLLRESGFGFYLGSEAFPKELPAELSASPRVFNPVFTTRGILPWYNFFNSPTTWDPIDHRALVDQLIRMGANTVTFHTYDHEPFAAYQEDGQMKWGGRLLNTKASSWGTNPTPVNEFEFGLGKVFADDYFGAATTHLAKDDNVVIMIEQDIMQEALDYAHKRGLMPGIGFEINGDPTKPSDRDIFLKRLNRVLDLYPAAEYIWLWQHETQGAQGYSTQYNMHSLRDVLDPQSWLVQYGQSRRKSFDYVVNEVKGLSPYFQDNETGKTARAIEGARLEQFAMLAYRAVSRREHQPKLVIAGWGGDDRLNSADYYAGLHHLLPEDIIFSSLDHIAPRTRIDKVYSVLPAPRQRWPIPWLENDGDLWHPQPYVAVYEQMVRDAHHSQSQGILGITWRTRDIEENFAYVVEYAWNPNLTADSFFKTLAQKCYDPEISDEMAVVHRELDALGYRWIGVGGQDECAPFIWRPADDTKSVQLEKIRNRVARLSTQAKDSRTRLNWLLNRIDFSLYYHQAEKNIAKAYSLLKDIEQSPDDAKKRADEAMALLDNAPLAEAMHRYVNRLSTRGEYGVLATMNTKATVSWQALKQKCYEVLGLPYEQMDDDWTPENRILLPRFLSSVASGEPLTLDPIVLGGQDAYVHYRILGTKQWITQKMTVKKEWVHTLTIPAQNVKSPGLELGFSFSNNSEDAMAFGPFAITVMKTSAVTTKASRVRTISSLPGSLRVREQSSPNGLFELVWDPMLQADYFKVYRDNTLVVETPVSMLPDVYKGACQYRIEAIRDGKTLLVVTYDRK